MSVSISKHSTVLPLWKFPWACYPFVVSLSLTPLILALTVLRLCRLAFSRKSHKWNYSQGSFGFGYFHLAKKHLSCMMGSFQWIKSGAAFNQELLVPFGTAWSSWRVCGLSSGAGKREEQLERKPRRGQFCPWFGRIERFKVFLMSKSSPGRRQT